MKTFIIIILTLCPVLIFWDEPQVAINNNQTKAAIRGRLYSTLGIPLIGAQVEVRFGNKGLAFVTTNTEGIYEFKDLPAGQATVRVVAIGGLNFFDLREGKAGTLEYDEPRKVVELRVGQQLVLDFVIYVNLNDVPPLKSELEGFVRQSDNSSLETAGVPIYDATVKAVNVYSQKVMAETRTDVMGRYSLILPLEGQYVVQVSKPGFVAAATTVIARGEKRRVDLAMSVLRIR